MKNLICSLLLLTSSSCFAINFGPGPGGGGSHDEEKIEKEKAENLIVDESIPKPIKHG